MARLKDYSQTLDINQDAASGEGFYTGDVPPAGTYRAVVKFVKVKQNKNGDDMLNVLVEVREPKGTPKAEFNGYGIFNNLNLTDQGIPFVKAFWAAMGVDAEAFLTGKGLVDDKVDPPRVLKVGKVQIDGNAVAVVCKRTEFPTASGNWRLEVQRFLPVTGGADEDEDEYEEEEEVEVEEYEEDAEVEEDEDEEEESEDEDEEEETAGYTEEDLEDLTVIELKNILKEAEWTPADYKGYSREDLITAIINGESDEEEDEAEDDEPPF